MGPKKGVITQSVKDVVQSLVDDDLVSKDKIGTSVSLHLSKLCFFIVLVILSPLLSNSGYSGATVL